MFLQIVCFSPFQHFICFVVQTNWPLAKSSMFVILTNPPSTKSNLSSSSSSSFTWDVRTDSSTTRSSMPHSSYGSGLSPTPSLARAAQGVNITLRLCQLAAVVQQSVGQVRVPRQDTLRRAVEGNHCLRPSQRCDPPAAKPGAL